MTPDTLDLLRCPYCGGRLDLVESLPHWKEGDAVLEGILGCHCCTFPVVAGVPVLHLQPEAVAARTALEEGDPRRAFRALVALDDDRLGERFAAAAESPAATYRELVEILGAGFEGGYFLYRFSDPSYVTANAVVVAVAGTVLAGGGRAIDLCGGSGHLTASLLDLSSPAPVVADLFFAKLWLAARFVAPGCAPVCCDGNAPLPFARGSFSFAMCADAFMYIWTKRQMVGEMMRLLDKGGPTAAVITHAHNQLVWSPSHGQPLTPAGYRELFETLDVRIFAEEALLSDVVAGGPLDLTRREPLQALETEQALTLVASRSEEVFRRHPLPALTPGRGELRLNPLYAATADGPRTRLRLHFPDPDYEDEYGACRRYLAEEVTLEGTTVADVAAGTRSPEVLDLLRRRVVLEMPLRYY